MAASTCPAASTAWPGRTPTHILVSPASGRRASSRRPGYPFIVKRLKRGAAPCPPRGDLSAATSPTAATASAPPVLIDGHGPPADPDPPPARRPSATNLVPAPPGGVERLAIPLKVSPRRPRRRAADRQSRTRPGPSPASFARARWSSSISRAQGRSGHLKPTLVWRPRPRGAGRRRSTRDQLLVAILDNVHGRAMVCYPDPDGGWTAARLDLPDNLTIDFVAADHTQPRLRSAPPDSSPPPTLWLVDAGTGSDAGQRRCRRSSTPPATGRAVRGDLQRRDQIPYFVVHPDGHEARRLEPRPSSTPMAASRFPTRPTIRRPSASCGWSAAASSCWPTSAAAASSAPPGTRPA